MKLDRNLNPDGRGKYALLKLRCQDKPIPQDCDYAAELLHSNGLLDYGDTPDSEFFVIRLKDKFAGMALTAYGIAAMKDDPEWAQEVLKLAEKAIHHPNQKMPD